MKKDTQKDEFEAILDSVENEHKVFVDLNLDISEQVRYYLSLKSGVNTQKDLAAKLGKSESEISKWLCGMHNITLESIAKLTDAIGKDIIMTDIMARKKYQKIEYVPIYIEKQEQEAKAKTIEMFYWATDHAIAFKCNSSTTSSTEKRMLNKSALRPFKNINLPCGS